MSSVDGYVGSAGSELVDLIDLHVLCLNGEGCSLSLSPSTLGLEVRTMVSEQLPKKKGAKLVLYHLASPLMLQQTLQEQGIEGKTARLSCTYVPTDLYAAWRYLQGFQVPEPHLVLDGVTQIGGCTNVPSLSSLPESLTSLTFGDDVQPKPWWSDLAEQLAKLDFRKYVQPKSWLTLPSNQSLDQPKPLWRDLAEQLAKLDFRR